MKIKITDDLYDIAWRLRAVDDGYELYYDTVKKRYEIVADGRLQFVSPYSALDSRTVEYARQTRVERMDALIRQADAHNEALRAAREKQVKDEAAYKARQLTAYLENGKTDIPSFDKI